MVQDATATAGADELDKVAFVQIAIGQRLICCARVLVIHKASQWATVAVKLDATTDTALAVHLAKLIADTVSLYHLQSKLVRL